MKLNKKQLEAFNHYKALKPVLRAKSYKPLNQDFRTASWGERFKAYKTVIESTDDQLWASMLYELNTLADIRAKEYRALSFGELKLIRMAEDFLSKEKACEE